MLTTVQWSWCAVALHLVQAIIAAALTLWLDHSNNTNGVFSLVKPVRVWSHIGNNNTGMKDILITTTLESAGTLDVRWVIVAFFAMSAAFPTTILLLHLSPSFRFVEYAFSASCMIMAIAVETGINDIYTLQCMFVLTFATMLLGWLADFSPPPFSWVAHGTGWVTFLSAYSPILDSFLQSNAHSPVAAPGFVQVIVFLEFVLFGSFGLVQVYSLFFVVPVPPHTDEEREALLVSADTSADDNVDMAYVFLSFTAKTLLAWLIFSPFFV
jgi:hypothetical protein